MAILYPSALDAFSNPTPHDNLNSSGVLHDEQHANANDAIEALETKVGITGSADTASLDFRVASLETGSATASSGAGSPEGVVPGNKGKLYWNETDDSIWMKRTSGGNTNWWKILG